MSTISWAWSARDLHRHLFAAPGRTRDDRRLRHVGRHRERHAPERLDALGQRVDQLVLLLVVLVEEEMQRVERRPRDLPVMLLVEVPQRDRVGEDLVQVLDALPGDSLRERDRPVDHLAERLDLVRLLAIEGSRPIERGPAASGSAHVTPPLRAHAASFSAVIFDRSARPAPYRERSRLDRPQGGTRKAPNPAMRASERSRGVRTVVTHFRRGTMSTTWFMARSMAFAV